MVLEPDDDLGHLRSNAFQEGGNDENPKTTQIQRPMTRSRTKKSVEKDKAPKWRRMKDQVEKDEDPESETLSRQLIVAEGPNYLKAQVKYVFSYNFYLL